MTAALEAIGLSKTFVSGGGLFGLGTRRLVRAVDDVSFSVSPGRTLCLVGESGCGKTTIGRMILRLTLPSAGTVLLEGEAFTELRGEALRQRRQRVQMVFQDPSGCLNARMKAADIVAEPMVNFGLLDPATRVRRVAQLFEQVGLARTLMGRLPRSLSGGQRQRLGIARALAPAPAVIVADEAVAALDVSIRAQILNLMRDVQRQTGVAYLFISHDLAVVRYIADEIAVMYLGAIVERAPARRLFEAPAHPYTRALIASIPATHPSARKTRTALTGEVPSAAALPSGCRFRARCPLASALCASTAPPPREIAPGHTVACHHITTNQEEQRP